MLVSVVKWVKNLMMIIDMPYPFIIGAFPCRLKKMRIIKNFVGVIILIDKLSNFMNPTEFVT